MKASGNVYDVPSSFQNPSMESSFKPTESLNEPTMYSISLHWNWHTLIKSFKCGTYGTYYASVVELFCHKWRIDGNGVKFWIGEFFTTTCSCVSIEVEFWQRVSHIVWPPVPLLFSKLSEVAKKPLCPPSTHLLHPTLGPCSCPHDPSPPPAVQTSRSHSSTHTTQPQWTALPPTTLKCDMQYTTSCRPYFCLLYTLNSAWSLHRSFKTHYIQYGSLHANMQCLFIHTCCLTFFFAYHDQEKS